MTGRYGLVIDLERCIGCNTCIIACKVESGIETGSGIRVNTVGGARRDTPAGKFPHLRMHYLPVPCMHCEVPPCVEACPPGAIHKADAGVVLVDEDRCDGCRACLSACPYGTLVYQPGKDVVRKCNLCVQRIAQGLEPFCARCCETEAIFFGDLSDPRSKVSQLIEERRALPFMSELGTKPAVYYCPPKHRG